MVTLQRLVFQPFPTRLTREFSDTVKQGRVVSPPGEFRLGLYLDSSPLLPLQCFFLIKIG